jgi:hypothetical protein
MRGEQGSYSKWFDSLKGVHTMGTKVFTKEQHDIQALEPTSGKWAIALNSLNWAS